MAQFLTLLSTLLLFAVFSPIACSSSEMFSERRNRAPSIDTSDNSGQHLSGIVGSRLRKGYADSKEQTVTSSSSNKQAVDDSAMDKNIRSIFSTNLGPGLHLFKNTPPYVNQPHFNSYNDQMLSDQAALNTPSSSSSSTINDTDFFKVQRSPGGKLGIVYNDEYLAKLDKNRTNPSVNKQNIGSNKETRFQTHFFDGLSLKKDKPASALPTANHNNARDTAIHFPTEEPDESRENNEVDISDCLEDERSKNDKVFCSRLRNYPKQSHLENLIKMKFPNLESFLGEDLEPIKNVSSRINAPEEEYLCKSRVRVIYPQSGLNKDYNWLYIVNSENYKQGIRIEECLDTGATCGENTGLSLPKHYTATCEQGYIYRSLIAYANETIVKDTFRVPSCCKCVLRSY